MRPLKVLVALTYHRPHVSGLAIYAQRLVRRLERRGHRLTVLTSRYEPRLPAGERLDNVDVVRVPVFRRVGKGRIMPLFPVCARSLTRKHDVVNIHTPQFETALLRACARILGKPVLLTYQLDLKPSPGGFGRVRDAAVLSLQMLAAKLASEIVAFTEDYALHSSFLIPYLVSVVPPPVEVGPEDPSWTTRLQSRGMRQPCIGFAAQFAASKGVGCLLQALPAIVEQVPDVRVASTGVYRNSIGEGGQWQRLRPRIEQQRERLLFLDLLPDAAMASFYRLCDVVAVSSLDCTDAFGTVQVEAMMCGTTVVASDLPGVHEAVCRTGIGGNRFPGKQPTASRGNRARATQSRVLYASTTGNRNGVFRGTIHPGV